LTQIENVIKINVIIDNFGILACIKNDFLQVLRQNQSFTICILKYKIETTDTIASNH